MLSKVDEEELSAYIKKRSELGGKASLIIVYVERDQRKAAKCKLFDYIIIHSLHRFQRRRKFSRFSFFILILFVDFYFCLWKRKTLFATFTMKLKTLFFLFHFSFHAKKSARNDLINDFPGRPFVDQTIIRSKIFESFNIEVLKPHCKI